ncbi:MAG: YlmH/Sll1252 family protein [Kyrpidia sp.]|nr:YlmH/Sll1252 family protein [Kyrpidia sp.]
MSFPWESHLHPGERPFARQALRWVEAAGERWRPVLTDFYDHRRQQIVRVIAATVGGVKVRAWGGYPEAERARLWIAPEPLVPREDDWELGFVRVRARGASWSHGDVLGSLLGLGIRREKIGDLSVAPEEARCIVTEEMTAFLCVHWRKIGRFSVHPEAIADRDFVPPEMSWREERVSVASLRLDAVLHEALHWPRQKAADWIKKGMVQVNWAVCGEVSREVAAGDTLSVRGVGRLRIAGVEGRSRRGRWILRVGFLQ